MRAARGTWNKSTVQAVIELAYERWGAHRDWEHNTVPGYGRTDEYKQWCRDLAEVINCDPGGIEATVCCVFAGKWGDTIRKPVTFWAIVRALEIGFITEDECPYFINTNTDQS